MSQRIFNIVDFGAISGVEYPQTSAIQATLDTCFSEGGGEIVIPKGDFVTGDIRIRSNTTLHLLEGARLIGSKNAEDYTNINSDEIEPLPTEQNTKLRWRSSYEWQKNGGGFKAHLYTAGSYWNYGIIRAVYAENVAIIGEKGSRIDGRNLFDPNGENNYRGPHAINMHFCKNITLRGYTVENAGNWGHAIFQSENVVFDSLTVLGGHDALHTRSCKNILVKDCKLMTGDDAVAGFNNVGVHIQNCEISSACSAFRYGGSDILVENCKVFAPCPYQFRGSFTYEEKSRGELESENGRRNMLSFWTNFVSDDLPLSKPAGNIVIRNCTVKNADRFLHLNLSGNEAWQRGNPPTDITFENIKAEGIEQGLVVYGIEGAPMEITLKNLEYSCRNGAEKNPIFRVAHCDAINLENVKLNNFKGEILVKVWSNEPSLTIDKLDCKKSDFLPIEHANEPFECRPI